jgi:anti-sigma B factor antagonist
MRTGGSLRDVAPTIAVHAVGRVLDCSLVIRALQDAVFFDQDQIPMSPNKDIFEVYQTGELTVVGFGDREILDQIDVSACRAEIIALVEKHKCKTLAFDLSGVKLIPSGMLGLLASLRRLNIVVHLYNPSPDIAEVLQITRLNEVLPIHYIDLDAQRD